MALSKVFWEAPLRLDERKWRKKSHDWQSLWCPISSCISPDLATWLKDWSQRRNDCLSTTPHDHISILLSKLALFWRKCHGLSGPFLFVTSCNIQVNLHLSLYGIYTLTPLELLNRLMLFTFKSHNQVNAICATGFTGQWPSSKCSFVAF